jgi:hypothetical protein
MMALDELVALGAFYGAPVDAVLSAHGSALGRYAEWVLGRDSFALVTLGSVAELASYGSATSARRLCSAAARWPAAVTGIKLAPDGHEEPTLYVRAVCPWRDGIEWLEGEVGAVATRVPTARTLYGLGFQGELIKTYALVPNGFVSWRVEGAQLCREHKDYRADVSWDAIAWPDAKWQAIGALGRTLGFCSAGHVGRSSEMAEMKIYVERVGAIATDRSFA